MANDRIALVDPCGAKRAALSGQSASLGAVPDRSHQGGKGLLLQQLEGGGKGGQRPAGHSPPGAVTSFPHVDKYLSGLPTVKEILVSRSSTPPLPDKHADLLIAPVARDTVAGALGLLAALEQLRAEQAVTRGAAPAAVAELARPGGDAGAELAAGARGGGNDNGVGVADASFETDVHYGRVRDAQESVGGLGFSAAARGDGGSGAGDLSRSDDDRDVASVSSLNNSGMACAGSDAAVAHDGSRGVAGGDALTDGVFTGKVVTWSASASASASLSVPLSQPSVSPPFIASPASAAASGSASSAATGPTQAANLASSAPAAASSAPAFSPGSSYDQLLAHSARLHNLALVVAAHAGELDAALKIAARMAAAGMPRDAFTYQAVLAAAGPDLIGRRRAVLTLEGICRELDARGSVGKSGLSARAGSSGEGVSAGSRPQSRGVADASNKAGEGDHGIRRLGHESPPGVDHAAAIKAGPSAVSINALILAFARAGAPESVQGLLRHASGAGIAVELPAAAAAAKVLASVGDVDGITALVSEVWGRVRPPKTSGNSLPKNKGEGQAPTSRDSAREVPGHHSDHNSPYSDRYPPYNYYPNVVQAATAAGMYLSLLRAIVQRGGESAGTAAWQVLADMRSRGLVGTLPLPSPLAPSLSPPWAAAPLSSSPPETGAGHAIRLDDPLPLAPGGQGSGSSIVPVVGMQGSDSSIRREDLASSRRQEDELAAHPLAYTSAAVAHRELLASAYSLLVRAQGVARDHQGARRAWGEACSVGLMLDDAATAAMVRMMAEEGRTPKAALALALANATSRARRSGLLSGELALGTIPGELAAGKGGLLHKKDGLRERGIGGGVMKRGGLLGRRDGPLEGARVGVQGRESDGWGEKDWVSAPWSAELAREAIRACCSGRDIAGAVAVAWRWLGDRVLAEHRYLVAARSHLVAELSGLPAGTTQPVGPRAPPLHSGPSSPSVGASASSGVGQSGSHPGGRTPWRSPEEGAGVVSPVPAILVRREESKDGERPAASSLVPSSTAGPLPSTPAGTLAGRPPLAFLGTVPPWVSLDRLAAQDLVIATCCARGATDLALACNTLKLLARARVGAPSHDTSRLLRAARVAAFPSSYPFSPSPSPSPSSVAARVSPFSSRHEASIEGANVSGNLISHRQGASTDGGGISPRWLPQPPPRIPGLKGFQLAPEVVPGTGDADPANQVVRRLREATVWGESRRRAWERGEGKGEEGSGGAWGDGQAHRAWGVAAAWFHESERGSSEQGRHAVAGLLQPPPASAYAGILEGMAAKRDPGATLLLLEHMARVGVAPDAACARNAIAALTKASSARQAAGVAAYMEALHDIPLDASMVAAMVAASWRAGQSRLAVRLIDLALTRWGPWESLTADARGEGGPAARAGQDGAASAGMTTAQGRKGDGGESQEGQAGEVTGGISRAELSSWAEICRQARKVSHVRLLEAMLAAMAPPPPGLVAAWKAADGKEPARPAWPPTGSAAKRRSKSSGKARTGSPRAAATGDQ